jgi:transposase
MAGKLPMGNKELLRAKVMEMVREGQLTLRQAAGRLKRSPRQVKRIWARYQAQGDAGLLHGNQGRPSNRRLGDSIRQAVLEAYRKYYPDFGPTLAAEKLAERQQLQVDHETLRRWLMVSGQWQRHRRRSQYRSRRTRRERFGELVQFDGSPHEWFEGRGPACCLMNMVDDARGISLAFLCAQETTEAAMRLLWAWIQRYGIPQALYCDRKNAFVLDGEPSIEDQLTGRQPESPFQRACRRLGIELIVAHSPQAKGRVERNHGVYQDRFVKELRLAGIHSIEQANRYLAETYLPAINARFAKAATEPEDAHVPLVDGTDLRDVFCFEEQRVVSRDYVLQFERRLYQIPRRLRHRPQPGGRVVVRKWLDGSVHFYWKDKPLLVQELILPQPKEVPASLSA